MVFNHRHFAKSKIFISSSVYDVLRICVFERQLNGERVLDVKSVFYLNIFLVSEHLDRLDVNVLRTGHIGSDDVACTCMIRFLEKYEFSSHFVVSFD